MIHVRRDRMFWLHISTKAANTLAAPCYTNRQPKRQCKYKYICKSTRLGTASLQAPLHSKAARRAATLSPKLTYESYADYLKQEKIALLHRHVELKFIINL